MAARNLPPDDILEAVAWHLSRARLLREEAREARARARALGLAARRGGQELTRLRPTAVAEELPEHNPPEVVGVPQGSPLWQLLTTRHPGALHPAADGEVIFSRPPAPTAGPEPFHLVLGVAQVVEQPECPLPVEGVGPAGRGSSEQAAQVLNLAAVHIV